MSTSLTPGPTRALTLPCPLMLSSRIDVHSKFFPGVALDDVVRVLSGCRNREAEWEGAGILGNGIVVDHELNEVAVFAKRWIPVEMGLRSLIVHHLFAGDPIAVFVDDNHAVAPGEPNIGARNTGAQDRELQGALEPPRLIHIAELRAERLPDINKVTCARRNRARGKDRTAQEVEGKGRVLRKSAPFRKQHPFSRGSQVRFRPEAREHRLRRLRCSDRPLARDAPAEAGHHSDLSRPASARLPPLIRLVPGPNWIFTATVRSFVFRKIRVVIGIGKIWLAAEAERWLNPRKERTPLFEFIDRDISGVIKRRDHVVVVLQQTEGWRFWIVQLRIQRRAIYLSASSRGSVFPAARILELFGIRSFRTGDQRGATGICGSLKHQNFRPA